MSERERADQEPRVSPYLLRPARTYEEYLRDRAIADRLQKQFENGGAVSMSASTSATNRNAPVKANAKPSRAAWNQPKASADPALAATGQSAGQRDSRDPANNQT